MANNNNNKNLNVPNLRFPEFSGEWKKFSLENLTNRIIRRNNNKESLLPLTISSQYGLVDQTSFFKKQVASDNLSNYYLLYNGDFAYNKSYSKDYRWGAVKRLDKYDKGVISNLYICFKPVSLFHSDFAVHYFETTKWYQGIAYIAGEGARNHGLLNISVNDYFRTIHFIPSEKEQDRISTLFNLITERIATQNKIIEDLKRLMSAIYLTIFEREKADIISLGSVCEIVKGKQINGEFLSEKGAYYVMNGGIIPSGYYHDYNVEPNTISISEGGNSCGYVQYNNERFWSGGHCYTLQRISPQINTLYLFHFLKYREDAIMKLRIGSGLPNIQKKDLMLFKILLPKVDRQTKLSQAFYAIDLKCKIENSLLRTYEKQKQFLLQQMFI